MIRGRLRLTHSVAAALAAGADGIVLGTRLLATPEADYAQPQKDAIVAAKGANATMRTTVFDELRHTTDWPEGTDGRALRNDTTADLAAGVSREEMQQKFDAALKTSDTSRIIVWAGTSVGLVKQILPASKVVQEVEREAVAALRRVQIT